jgi:DNA-binding transcriptional LysR family regulator
MPDFTQMKTFILAAEKRNLAEVGRQLGISSAAVSKQLTKLEEELGIHLLTRSTRKIELTEIGEIYNEQCKRILEEVDASNALISQTKLSPKGLLKIVSARHFGSMYIVPHIAEFLELYPDIELNIELAERIPDLEREGIDVLIGMSISAGPGAIQRRIATTSYKLCASPSYIKKWGTPFKPKDLTEHRYISHSMRKPDNVVIFQNEKISIKPFLQISDAQAMLNLALEGVGMIYLHDYMVNDSIKRGELIEVLQSYSLKNIPLYVAFPERRYVTSKIRYFIDFIFKKINESN